MFAAPSDPYADLADIVEVSLPAVLVDAAQPRALTDPSGAPDVPYVDAQWPQDEARISSRYQFLTRLANALHPSAPINAAAVSSILALGDPVTGEPVFGRAAAETARDAVDRFDLRAARAALVRGALEYARGVEADARVALTRLNERFNNANLARSVSPTLRARAVPVPRIEASRAAAAQAPMAPRRLPVGVQRAVAPLLGRRQPVERPVAASTVGAGPPRRPAWSSALGRLLPGPAAPRAPAFGQPARPRAQQQPPPPQQRTEGEEEEEEPLIKRRRRIPTPGSPLALASAAAALEDDLLLAALLAEEQGAPSIQEAPPSTRGWDLAAALATAARQPPMSATEYLVPTPPRTPRTPQRAAAQERPQQPWTIDTSIQVVKPGVVRRPVDVEVLRQEAQRARSLADAIRDGYAARIAPGDAEAAAGRALYLEDLAAYVEALGARRRPEPFDASYWYRVVAAGGSGPLGPPAALAEARGVVGPYATAAEAEADASLFGFDADEAAMDAVLAWSLAMGAPSLTRPATTLFRVQRPPRESDPSLPRGLAARTDPGVERWVTAVVTARPPDALPQAGALAVLGWDRDVAGRARRVGARDVFCPGRGRPCAVVAAYEAPSADEARAVEEALAARQAPPNVPAAVGEIADAARALYPGAAVSVAPNRDGSAVLVTVRLPVPLADADLGRLLDLARAAYGVVAATGAPIDTEASRVVGIDASEAPIPSPASIVAATMS
nr:hypothetical protein [Pandoravirus belohorizontensis]